MINLSPFLPLPSSAVINGLNNGYLDDGFLAPSDYRVAQTISTLNDVFNSMFPINTIDTRNGLGGILYGRYEGVCVFVCVLVV